MVVSRRTVSVVVEVSLVSPSPPHCVLCAKQFALRAHNTPHLAFMCSLGECFAEEPLEGLCWVSFFAPIGPASVLDAMRCTSGWLRLGFLRHAKPSYGVSPASRGSHEAIPPIGGDQAASDAGVGVNWQATSANNAGVGSTGRPPRRTTLAWGQRVDHLGEKRWCGG